MAYRKGYLTNSRVNAVQNWALSYYMFKEQERDYQKQEDFWKMLTMLTNPELYQKVYQQELAEANLESGYDGSGEEGFSNDLDVLEEYMQRMRNEQRVDENMEFVDDGGWK